MNFNIGKIISYNDKQGLILTDNGEKYLFLESDLNQQININDLVFFRPESINNIKRAFFINKINDYLNIKNNKKNIKKYLKSIIKED